MKDDDCHCILIFHGGKAEAIFWVDDEDETYGTKNIGINVEKYNYPNCPSPSQLEDIHAQIKGIDKLIEELTKAKKELENGTPSA